MCTITELNPNEGPKWMPRAGPVRFAGYDNHNDAYERVFDGNTEKIVRTRDVTFHDNRFTEMKRLYINKERSNDEH